MTTYIQCATFVSMPTQKTAARVISLRVPAADLAMARRQAERKGLPYQTYIKSLIHTALAKRDKKKG